MNPLILVDSNGICHQMKHAIKNLSFNEVETGIIFGFLLAIRRMAQKYPDHQFVFSWDSRRSLRKEIYPEYKANRNNNLTDVEKRINELAYVQFDIIRDEILPMLGFSNIFTKDGFESDDIIAIISKEHEAKILSTDSDLYQLLREGEVSIINPRTKEEFTYAKFQETYGIPPSDWAMIKAMGGCTSDNVIGIPGVGEITAVKYIKGTLKVGSKTWSAIKANSDTIKRNLRVVKLPIEEAAQMTFPIKEDNMSLSGFLTICSRYGLYSFVEAEELTRWKHYVHLK